MDRVTCLDLLQLVLFFDAVPFCFGDSGYCCGWLPVGFRAHSTLSIFYSMFIFRDGGE